MRKLLLTCTFLSALIAGAQTRSYTSAELKRLEDLGRLWGVVHYFHPEMGSGRIVTDSLIVGNAASLAADPSAANFRNVVRDLLGRVGDPATRLMEPPAIPEPMLLTHNSKTPVVRRYRDSTWYISLPTEAFTNGSMPDVPGVDPATWDDARAIVLDLRNRKLDAGPAEWADMNFFRRSFDPLRARLLGNTPLPAVYTRRVSHQGFTGQGMPGGGIYYSGWRTLEQDANPLPPALAKQTPVNIPVLFVVNQQTDTWLTRSLLQFQAAGRALVVFEGDPARIAFGELMPVKLADSLVAAVRVTDEFLADGALPRPAVVVPRINEFEENGPFLTLLRDAMAHRATLLANSKGSGNPSPAYRMPQPGRYPNRINNPDVGLRLMGLYNYWNAIQYFFPYKDLMTEPWDGQLAKHLPAFLAATDGLKYQFALYALVSEIGDSHGFIQNDNSRTPVRDTLGYRPPLNLEFIGPKLYVVDIGRSGGQEPAGVELWDEVVAVNGTPVLRQAERFRNWIASSNESTFYRDVPNMLHAGPMGSKVELLLRRNGKDTTVTLERSSRGEGLHRRRTDFNDDHRTMELLPGNIGYVNLGALNYNEIDTMFAMMKDTKAIIFDVRNYPKGTAWGIAPRLALRDTMSTRFDVPLVDLYHIQGGEGKTTATSYFTVRPDNSKPRYAGKVVLLCNERTQSQAEYSIMMLQAAGRATVIGSQTAGADGNVTNVVLPGGYSAYFTGACVLYPDGKQTQRTGIRVDIQARPTLAGLKAGKDEVLDRALRYLSTGK